MNLGGELNWEQLISLAGAVKDFVKDYVKDFVFKVPINSRIKARSLKRKNLSLSEVGEIR